MMKTKGLTATIVFEAQSLNYDEGYGNLSIIKKFHRGDGNVYTYASRQSLRYAIFIQGCQDPYKWKPSNVVLAGEGNKRVVQLISDITESVESDLFGYMRTNVPLNSGAKDKKNKGEVSIMRTAPVRLTPAISLEPFRNDMEMLTNKYQSDKIQAQPNISNSEVHRSLYKYTITVDLHRIGTEEDVIGTRISPNKETKPEDFKNFVEKFRKIHIDNEKKAQRVKELLSIIGNLYRDIRGRREDLKPLFIIGGVYDICNPFFVNIIRVDYTNNLPRIVLEPIRQILEHNTIKNHTYIGIREGIFMNTITEFQAITTNVDSPECVITKLQEEVTDYYKSNNSSCPK